MNPCFGIELWDIRIYLELVQIAHILLQSTIDLDYLFSLVCLYLNKLCAVLGWHYLSMRGIIILTFFIVTLQLSARLGHWDHCIIRKSRIISSSSIALSFFMNDLS